MNNITKHLVGDSFIYITLYHHQFHILHFPRCLPVFRFDHHSGWLNSLDKQTIPGTLGVELRRSPGLFVEKNSRWTIPCYIRYKWAGWENRLTGIWWIHLKFSGLTLSGLKCGRLGKLRMSSKLFFFVNVTGRSAEFAGGFMSHPGELWAILDTHQSNKVSFHGFLWIWTIMPNPCAQPILN